MNRIKGFIIKHGQIDYRNITIFLLSVLLVFTYLGYREKSRFEDAYNQEFFTNFNRHFASENSSLIRYLTLVDRALNNHELDANEIDQLESDRSSIVILEQDLARFHSRHYKKEIQYNRIFIYDFIDHHSRLWEPYFESVGENQFVLKDSALERIELLYLKAKIESALEVVERYHVENREQYNSFRAINGKGFVKSAIWMELFKELEANLISIEQAYNFGEFSPDEIIAVTENDGYIPSDIRYRGSFLRVDRGYRIVTNEFGVYFNIATRGYKRNFHIISITRDSNEITITINEEGISKFNPPDSAFIGTSMIALLRGLNPNEIDQLHFNVINEDGTPFPEI